MPDLMKMNIISCFFTKDKHIDVYRDKWGKFYVRVGGVITQRKLNAKEIVRYLSNLANDR